MVNLVLLFGLETFVQKKSCSKIMNLDLNVFVSYKLWKFKFKNKNLYVRYGIFCFGYTQN